MLKFRDQPPEVFYKKSSSEKFHNFHRKTPVLDILESIFNKVAVLQGCNFIKNRLQRRCFPVNIAKFLRTAIFFSSVGIIARPAVKMPWAIKNSYFAERLRTIVSEVSNLCLKSPAPNIACGFSIS